jgi:hypothetical protein
MTGAADVGLRNRVVASAHGAVILLLGGQEAMDDIEGGVRSEQWRMVAAQTRYLILLCCHVRGLAFGAEPYLYEDGAALDPCTYLPESEVTTAIALIHEVPDSSTSPEAVADWLDRVRAWMADTEKSLRLPEPLPELRSPEGMFGALRLVRGWSDLVDELGLPALMPIEWTKSL